MDTGNIGGFDEIGGNGGIAGGTPDIITPGKGGQMSGGGSEEYGLER